MTDHVLSNLNQLGRRVAALESLEQPFFGYSVRVFDSSNTSIADSSTTILTFDSESWDTAAQHSTSANSSRLTVVQAGIYSIIANVRWAVNSTGRRQMAIKYNNTTYIGNSEVPGNRPAQIKQITTAHYNMSTGDYVEVEVFQSSGGALDIVQATDFSPIFSMVRIP